ncbi:MAG TPA: endonuclease/exonuclease/phosphatase family protein [Tepidisphaeraceae bacterium]|jgi:endonuclease/exonuclease/phosphatase family metal-dependent hydrolase
MRILSYNILDGGADRADLLGCVIESQRPDVVGLVEAEDASVVATLANRLGMDFIQAEGNKRGSAAALLSRLPIRHSINHAPHHPAITKSLLEAAVVDPSGNEWTLGILHLHAHATEADEQIREREIAEVLEIFRPHREANRPHLLMGDFNANAPYLVIEPTLCKMSTRKEWYQNGGKLPRRVIARVLEAGYHDSLRDLYPAAAETAGSFSTEFPGQRVDYIFTFGIEAARLKQARVVYDEPAKIASDHYPVFLEV